jgi:FtsH-binding integral membrane protein
MKDATNLTTQDEQEISTFFNVIYNTMMKGIGLSAIVAFVIGMLLPPSMAVVISIAGLIAFLVVGLWVLSPKKVMKMKPTKARNWFYIYCAVTGAAFCTLGYAYPVDILFMAFVSAAVTFATASVYGKTTGKNLQGWGPYLMVALISLLVVMIINLVMVIFFGIDIGWLEALISVAGIIIFTGLTAYESQGLKESFIDMGGLENKDTYNLAMVGTMSLYLSFVNLFLFFARLFGYASSD